MPCFQNSVSTACSTPAPRKPPLDNRRTRSELKLLKSPTSEEKIKKSHEIAEFFRQKVSTNLRLMNTMLASADRPLLTRKNTALTGGDATRHTISKID